MLHFGGDDALAQHHGVVRALHRDALAAGEDFVTAVLVIPFGQRGGHVHLLDDVAPADARVVRAERDFALLRGVGDDALLGTAEIVVE